jgi:hypothetical protein
LALQKQKDTATLNENKLRKEIAKYRVASRNSGVTSNATPNKSNRPDRTPDKEISNLHTPKDKPVA